MAVILSHQHRAECTFSVMFMPADTASLLTKQYIKGYTVLTAVVHVAFLRPATAVYHPDVGIWCDVNDWVHAQRPWVYTPEKEGLSHG